MKPLLEEKEHLENGTHPDFVVGLKKLETEYEEELGKIANREMVRPHNQDHRSARWGGEGTSDLVVPPPKKTTFFF